MGGGGGGYMPSTRAMLVSCNIRKWSSQLKRRFSHDWGAKTCEGSKSNILVCSNNNLLCTYVDTIHNFNKNDIVVVLAAWLTDINSE